MAQRRGRATAVLAVAALAGLTGCADGEAPGTGVTSSAQEPGPTRTVEPAQSETIDPGVAAAAGSGCEPGAGVLSDGRWYGTVVSLTTDELELDVACWFIGEDAVMAADEDGEESPPPNDYYVRDEDDATSTVPVAAEASVIMYPSDTPQERLGTVAELIEVAESRDGFPYGVWVEVADGGAVSIMEQWVP